MKDITLKITGKQHYDENEDQMEFVTDGKLYARNGALYILYDETEMSGMEGCTTILKLKGNSLKMKRNGVAGFNTELYFEAGKRFHSFYETPYGPMSMEVVTDYVESKFDEEAGIGSIDVQYQVSLEGLAEGTNTLTIDIM